MSFIPHLNINKHPAAIKDGTMIDAMNMIISKDNSLIHTEYGTTICKDIIDGCIAITNNPTFNLKFAIPCNNEIVLVVQNKDGFTCSIIRYDEVSKRCYLCADKYYYAGGEVSTTFTYNRGELIIAIAESLDNEQKIPLKVINLGVLGEDTYINASLNNDRYFPICPLVKIPACKTEYISGSATKGWYYVFVRYKISNSNYTPWYNTNDSIFIDSFNLERFFNIFTSKDAYVNKNYKPYGYSSMGQVSISDSTDVAKISFKCNVDVDTDDDYKHYQLGFVCVSKTYTKAYRSDDIPITNKTFEFKKESVFEYDVVELTKQSNNYYNVKSVATTNNRLYIGNYEEYHLDTKIDVSNISIDLDVVARPKDFVFFAEGIIDNDDVKTSSTTILGAVDNGAYEGIKNKNLPVKSIIAAKRDNPDTFANINAISRNNGYYIYGENFIGYKDNNITSIKTMMNDKNLSIDEDFIIIYKNKYGDADTYYIKNIKNLLFNPADKEHPYADIDRSRFDNLEVINNALWNTKSDDPDYSDVDPSVWNPAMDDIWKATNIHIVEFSGNVSASLRRSLRQRVDGHEPSGTIEELFKNRFGFNLSDLANNDFVITKRQTVGGVGNPSVKFKIVPVHMSKFIYMTEKYKNKKGTVNEEDEEKYNTDFGGYSTNALYSSAGINPNNKYNLFVHFVDAYGSATRGIPISEFLVNIKSNQDVHLEYNKGFIGIANVNTCDKIYTISARLSNIPYNYVGYFFSYEEVESDIKHIGIAITNGTNTIRLYNDNLNYKDKLDFKFDTIELYDTKKEKLLMSYGDDNDSTVVLPNKDYTPVNIIDENFTYSYNKSTKHKIINKSFRAADGYNNVLTSTNILLQIEKSIKKGVYVAVLRNTKSDLYNKENKKLIPCSAVSYQTGNFGKYLTINTKDAFITKHHAITYDKADKVFFNNVTKTFNTNKTNEVIDRPAIQYTFYAYDSIPNEAISFNNKPEVVFFPNAGLNTTNEREKSYYIGSVVECKNTVDLYQQKNFSIYDSYPKPLAWRNPSNKFTDKFEKTIRRSNTIQDESFTVNWRKFNQEDYKNIIENKGSITKLISFGNIFFVHTKHSMFEFNDTDTIKSDNGNIQLASIDPWDIKYRELLTSSLGYAGLKHASHSIDGEFGYIFYDADASRFYQYDAGRFKSIDEDIRRYALLYGEVNAVKFVNDKNNGRLLIQMDKDDDTSEVLSYNYEHGKFISRHTYRFEYAFNTKTNTYIVGKETNGQTNNNIVKYDYNKRTTYDGLKDNTSISAYINPIINTEYYSMKYVEYISYKLRHIDITDSISNPDYFNSPVEGTSPKYASDAVTIRSEFCNTGKIDTDIVQHNVFDDYKKPYWRLGNWYLNLIRDGIDEYNADNKKAGDSSRVFGNWFTIKFEFNRGKNVEFENVDCRFSKDISE